MIINQNGKFYETNDFREFIPLQAQENTPNPDPDADETESEEEADEDVEIESEEPSEDSSEETGG